MRKFLMAMTAILATTMFLAPSPGFASTDAGFETNSDDATFDKRSKPRIPGGSGCDDPDDVIEHPECR